MEAYGQMSPLIATTSNAQPHEVCQATPCREEDSQSEDEL